eukprot:CAMPEP_0201543896 /NCGR_PEP_ID=MMETSP0161_2-20130828/72866_1 /ASSEMBLY_ACC=CAM_ASM_000251 /TAXON_ID=180227 /ORGANISM="Neoparamoeba aestuarina, Strain SoJaBio B1-5/56/2" /LENGTH=31 /DNA_ID= /DNA_START= /DNA_END= /DNA_ORIENTATION=
MEVEAARVVLRRVADKKRMMGGEMVFKKVEK